MIFKNEMTNNVNLTPFNS